MSFMPEIHDCIVHSCWICFPTLPLTLSYSLSLSLSLFLSTCSDRRNGSGDEAKAFHQLWLFINDHNVLQYVSSGPQNVCMYYPNYSKPGVWPLLSFSLAIFSLSSSSISTLNACSSCSYTTLCWLSSSTAEWWVAENNSSASMGGASPERKIVYNTKIHNVLEQIYQLYKSQVIYMYSAYYTS